MSSEHGGPSPEEASSDLLSRCIAVVNGYGEKQGGDPTGDFFHLPTNGRNVYITSDPANMKLKPGEICIAFYDSNMKFKFAKRVETPEEALVMVKEWGEEKPI